VVDLADLRVWVAEKGFSIHWVRDSLGLGSASPTASHCTHMHGAWWSIIVLQILCDAKLYIKQPTCSC
jgi:hypothetical protein